MQKSNYCVFEHCDYSYPPKVQKTFTMKHCTKLSLCQLNSMGEQLQFEHGKFWGKFFKKIKKRGSDFLAYRNLCKKYLSFLIFYNLILNNLTLEAINCRRSCKL